MKKKLMKTNSKAYIISYFSELFIQFNNFRFSQCKIASKISKRSNYLATLQDLDQRRRQRWFGLEKQTTDPRHFEQYIINSCMAWYKLSSKLTYFHASSWTNLSPDEKSNKNWLLLCWCWAIYWKKMLKTSLISLAYYSMVCVGQETSCSSLDVEKNTYFPIETPRKEIKTEHLVRAWVNVARWCGGDVPEIST